jgi:hypothetical protein
MCLPQRSNQRDDDAVGNGNFPQPMGEERTTPVPLDAVPRLAVTAEGLRLLPLDARAAYLLSLVDGRSTVDVVLDVCEMAREEAIGILVQLLRLGAIALNEP